MDLHGEVDLDAHPTADRSAVGESVPVIDISSLSQGTADDVVVREIAAACESWGFFQVVGHDVPEDLIDRVWTKTRDLFAMPPDIHQAIRRNAREPLGLLQQRTDQESAG